MNKPNLRIQNLSKSIGAHTILKNISIELVQGELISLLGPSGSGKTTLLRCVAGLDPAHQQTGAILWENEVLTDSKKNIPAESRRFGMVFQNYAVWPHLNVFENVAFPLRVEGGMPESEIQKRVRQSLEWVQLTHYEKRFSHELSGGQQQRVAIARALVMSPRLLLLDEPLSNLDAVLRDELREEIQRIQKELHLTTVLVTHDQKEALSMSDRVVLLNHGEMDCIGTPEQLYLTPPTPFAAEFLAGAQRLPTPDQGECLFLPRKWNLSGGQIPAGAVQYHGKIQTRSFLGSEYEYHAEVHGMNAAIFFYAKEQLPPGTEVLLTQTPHRCPTPF